MIEIIFRNAQVRDDGYGLYVNGKDLDKIISTALGTRVGNDYGISSALTSFHSNCCDITITIDPKAVTECIDTGEELWSSVEEMEANKLEQYKQKTETAES